MKDFLLVIDKFVLVQEPKSKQLGKILVECGGITTLTHSIESVTLPTWHTCQEIPSHPVKQTIDDVSFAKKIHFLQKEYAELGEAIPFPDANSHDYDLYMVSQIPAVADVKPHFPQIIFDPEKHVQPDVLWFQPYDQAPQLLNYSLTLGLKIEAESIDGMTIPIPNIEMSLTENNSRYFQGSIPISNIMGIHPSGADDNAVTLYQRTKYSRSSQPIGLAYRDMSNIPVPRFASDEVESPPLLSQAFNYRLKLILHDDRSMELSKAFTWPRILENSEDLPTEMKKLFILNCVVVIPMLVLLLVYTILPFIKIKIDPIE